MLKSKIIAGCLSLTVMCTSMTVFAEQVHFSDQAILRQDFALVLAKTLGIQPIYPDQSTFKDVDQSQMEYGYVEALVQLGLLKGDTNSHFNGGQMLTRQDAAVLLYRALGAEDAHHAPSVAYLDAAEISAYAEKAVAFVSKQELMQGNNGLFFPKKTLTRAETAILAERLLNRGNLVGDYFWAVSPANLTLKVGEQKKITILSQPSLLAYTPTFGLDNPELGSISMDGVFTASKAGKGLITVNMGNRHHDLVVTVQE